MIRIGFSKSWPRMGWEIYAHRYVQTGRIPFKITIEEMPILKEFEQSEPSAVLREIEGQEIIRALIQGLTESELLPPIGATESELKATKKHLQDMRSIALAGNVKPEEKV